ncbi:MAG: hypothetical protein Q8L85_07695 [Alphaproteobacteria bacterium]|nr:hypothetical protein [Alphaproteobacteria bacterium]
MYKKTISIAFLALIILSSSLFAVEEGAGEAHIYDYNSLKYNHYAAEVEDSEKVIIEDLAKNFAEGKNWDWYDHHYVINSILNIRAEDRETIIFYAKELFDEGQIVQSNDASLFVNSISRVNLEDLDFFVQLVREFPGRKNWHSTDFCMFVYRLTQIQPADRAFVVQALKSLVESNNWDGMYSGFKIADAIQGYIV